MAAGRVSGQVPIDSGLTWTSLRLDMHSFCAAIIVLLTWQGFECVKFVSLDIPGAVILGEPVWISCNYDLEGDQLYSIKWYKNNVEFYRYLPKDKPFGQKYDLLGVHLELLQCNATHVRLHKTDLNSEGNYACEVSSEGPFYRTIKAGKEMRIYVLPEDGPVIRGVEKRYQIGDEVNVTCVSGPSKPPAYLKWFINDNEAPDFLETEYPTVRHHNGLQMSEVRLSFVADEGHFWRGQMKLRCTASISQIYSRSSEELMIGDRSSGIQPHHIPRVTPGQEGPTITGGLAKYDVGDIVDVNCTSAKTSTAAVLRWYINGQEAKSSYLTENRKSRHPDGLESSTLGLKFKVHRHHFRHNEMRLKCTATLSKVISMSSEETVVSANQQSTRLHVLENEHPYNSTGVPSSSVQTWILLAAFLSFRVMVT